MLWLGRATLIIIEFDKTEIILATIEEEERASLRAGSHFWVGDNNREPVNPARRMRRGKVKKTFLRPILLASSFARDTPPTSEPARRLGASERNEVCALSKLKKVYHSCN